MAQSGMFVDGLTYAAISRNLAQGIGTFWAPSYTTTLYPQFFDHPPLGFGLQVVAFAIFGDHLLVERAYSLAMGGVTAMLMMAIWRKHGWGAGARLAARSVLVAPGGRDLVDRQQHAREHPGGLHDAGGVRVRPRVAHGDPDIAVGVARRVVDRRRRPYEGPRGPVSARSTAGACSGDATPGARCLASRVGHVCELRPRLGGRGDGGDREERALDVLAAAGCRIPRRSPGTRAGGSVGARARAFRRSRLADGWSGCARARVVPYEAPNPWSWSRPARLDVVLLRNSARRLGSDCDQPENHGCLPGALHPVLCPCIRQPDAHTAGTSPPRPGVDAVACRRCAWRGAAGRLPRHAPCLGSARAARRRGGLPSIGLWRP